MKEISSSPSASPAAPSMSRLQPLRDLARSLPHPLNLWARRVGGTAYRLYRRTRPALPRPPQQIGPGELHQHQTRDRRERSRRPGGSPPRPAWPTQIEHHVADLEHAAFPEGAFDMVFAHHSAHHIEDLDGLCVPRRGNHSQLRPGLREDDAHLGAFFMLEDRLMAEGVIGSDFATLTAVSD